MPEALPRAFKCLPGFHNTSHDEITLSTSHFSLQCIHSDRCLAVALNLHNMQEEALLKVLLSNSRILGRSVERSLAPAASLLAEMGHSRTDVARMVVQQPFLLTCKPERYEEILSIMQEHGISEKVSYSGSRLVMHYISTKCAGGTSLIRACQFVDR